MSSRMQRPSSDFRYLFLLHLRNTMISAFELKHSAWLAPSISTQWTFSYVVLSRISSTFFTIFTILLLLPSFSNDHIFSAVILASSLFPGDFYVTCNVMFRIYIPCPKRSVAAFLSTNLHWLQFKV